MLKKSLTNEWVPGRALTRKDGILLAMPDLPVGDVAFEGFIRGRLIGREEETQRTNQFFHNILSSRAASLGSFAAEGNISIFSCKGAPEAEE